MSPGKWRIRKLSLTTNYSMKKRYEHGNLVTSYSVGLTEWSAFVTNLLFSLHWLSVEFKKAACQKYASETSQADSANRISHVWRLHPGDRCVIGPFREVIWYSHRISSQRSQGGLAPFPNARSPKLLVKAQAKTSSSCV